MTAFSPTRRGFLAGGAALIIGAHLPMGNKMAAKAATGPVDLNAFVRIGEDNTVTVIVKHIEFGQGPFTGFATLVAEELDADWSQMRAEHAPADTATYQNFAFGIQGTGASTAVRNAFTQMRQAGAAARAMLVDAAAREWGVSADEITVANGVISHTGSGKTAQFGELVAAASESTPPAEPKLKDPAEFNLIGKEEIRRLDSAIKTTGEAQFTLDVYRDGMLTVVVAHSPWINGKVASVDSSAALAVDGVEKVEQIPTGVAVYARNTYSALKGRDALLIDWDLSEAETRSAEEQLEEVATAARDGEGVVADTYGDLNAAFENAAQVIEAEYRLPFLAHAPLEALDGVIENRGDAVEIWMGSQMQSVDQMVTSDIFGIPLENVEINTLLGGGSFGRRAQYDGQFAQELAHVAKAGGEGTYKLVWTRSDDIQGGYYRPQVVHRHRAALDETGRIIGWFNKFATESIMGGSAFEAVIQNGVDPFSIEGSIHKPYDFGAFEARWVRTDSKVPHLWWRSVGHSHNAFANEVFLDEVLQGQGKDPVQGRLELLGDKSPRDRRVLERVAEMANWRGVQGADGKAFGVALHPSYDAHFAYIAEVSEVDGEPRVHKVWVAADVGIAVNPDVVKAQIEGGLGYGLSAALFNEITFAEDGRVEQENFDTYRLLRINEMPEVEIDLAVNTEKPGGIGEAGTPPIAPAVSNAWRILKGEPVRRLPLVRV
ncbi:MULTISPECIES: xanthine dehydrogenase family protein molybdopterin-binding subunit [unclassified Ruegeria]|uniref:xanthine dehydrogenase family protein molybdopterin-binding subunit n=1 Tax=unclassified Ruegeria TaxID=2625375 RepID=UPI0014926ABB|nr:MULTISPECIES: xanthine dehydrogenase family protein molybdopterin-binding subunit [unclassified Ruegeria]NOD88694.1 molybdopterin-dependent oxidoreductase [Ruegeria sp. HKCCD4318]NOE12078.1 molybdopterin-dependent oxidoreductase [Ruegeria sp. HKCCD4318-2]NOG09758.1 xanthine dehydrogenase family protein molybdopterin-binding subunit [Ruegeria sp. HKCCD4315]